MKEIPLTQGKITLVSDEDFESLSKFKWHAASSRGRWEARRQVMVDGRRKLVRMHNVILGFSPVDHKDRNALNNQRDNLRPCTPITNSQNRGMQNHSSRFKGVSLRKSVGRFEARIVVSGRKIHLGYFDDETDAARKYDEAATAHFGEFAMTNRQMGVPNYL